MSTDILITSLPPTASSPIIQSRVIQQGGESHSNFEISPSAIMPNTPLSIWKNLNSYNLHNSYRPIERTSPRLASRDFMEESMDVSKSWENVPSPICNGGQLGDAASLSDWDIVCIKPISLSESQYPYTLSTTSLTDVVCALCTPDEGIVVSEPMETVVTESHLVSNPLVCTTLAVYEPNPIQNLLLLQKPREDTLLAPLFPLQSSSWKGLYNLGNTCYMNASLQALLSIDGFVNTLMNTSIHENKNHSSNPTSQKILVEQLVRVFRRLRGEAVSEQDDEWTSIAESNDVNPTRFKEAIDEKSPLFVGYQQHDAHEFITTLLDLLHDELKHPEMKPIVETQPQDALPDSGLNVQEDSNYVVVNDVSLSITPSSMDGMSQNYAKKARLGSSRSFDFEEEDITDENNPHVPNHRPLSLSTLNMEGIEDLLTNTTQTSNISTYRGSLNGPDPRTWKPFWKFKNRPGYLVGGRSSAPLLSSSNRLSGYKSIDQSWQVIGNELLQGHSSSFHDDKSPITDSPPHSRNQRVCPSLAENNEPTKESSTSLVDSYFTTEIRNHLTCDSCKFTRSQIETFRCLSLELADNESPSEKSLSSLKFNQTLQDSLRKFLAPEKREIKCEKCFFDWATKTTEITKLPNALILHLKRFIVDMSPDYMTITCKKNHTPVEFSQSLSLNPWDEDGVLAEYLASDAKIPIPQVINDSLLHNKESQMLCDEATHDPSYCLRSIVHHLGSSGEYGHYTATVNRTTVMNSNDSSRSWLYCNDNHLSEMRENQVLDASSQTTAYLFLYELQGLTT